MSTKRCTGCKEEKPLDGFHREARSRDGRQPRCRACRAGYNQKNREKIRTYNKVYRETNRERLKEARSVYYQNNKDKFKAAHLKRYGENRDERIKYVLKWQKENKAHRRKYEREYVRRRRASDPEYRARLACRMVLWNTIYRTGKPGTYRTASRRLGYSREQLIETIQSRFKPGMTWSNHGEWHIDHKIPVAHFVSKGETRPHIINALCNLQPLWADDNRRKRDRHPLKEPNP